MEGVSYQSGLGEQNMSEVTVDRISSLPWNVLDIILGKLSLKDAIRTSVLATEWRYKWLSLSKFFLDSRSIAGMFRFKILQWVVVSNIINRYLLHHHFHHRLHHDGEIRTFVLRTYCSAHYPELYQWIQYLSKLDVEIMSLEEVGYLFFVVPSYLFLFKQLQSLNLEICAIKIPSSFRRFSFLRELSLRNVSISDDDLHHLILACPLLEKLALFRINELKHLNINSPRLFELQIDLGMEDVVIGNPTRLVSVHIIEYSVPQIINYNWRSVIRCFSSMVVLRKLDLCGSFIEILAADSAFENFPWRNNTLSFLSLSDVNCENIGAFRVCLSLLRSCPNIKKFQFVIDAAKGLRLITQFLKENKGLVSFPALDSIAVTCPYETGMGCTVNFIEFLCAHSPNLRSLSIAGWPDMKKTQVSRMLKRFENVCPRAEVMYTCGHHIM
ncbi:F-box/FBD/LRR-repeat protein At1g13570-like isoform X2 [Chenopodium quinoa]|nr:F-box/FBD/LRR-repeat protein At1g13570-like isoform X2 [Chenopodium quinoa]